MTREGNRYDATLELRACEFSIRTALRKCGLYLRSRPEAKVVGLRLYRGADTDLYRDAARALLKSSEALDHYHTASVSIGRRGETLCEDARDVVRMRSAVVVLIEHGTTMPSELELAFDRVVDLGPVQPAHLISAAREGWKMPITRDQAVALLRHPQALLFAALRRGRPIDDVLLKLATASLTVKPSKWEPTLKDLEGYGEAKVWGADLAADLADWRSGKISWRDVNSGLLLSGPQGTGKTLFASALARSCGASFIGTSSAQWQAKGHLGDMLGAMRRTFRDAFEQRPTIVLIDEIDAIGDRRSFRGDNAAYGVQVVDALLELLDGSHSRDGVVVIGASNLPDKVDPALRRPGRLDRHIVIGLPDQAARAHMLAAHLGSPSITAAASGDIARAMSGYSGALIAQVAKDARRNARKRGSEVTVDDVRALVPPLAAIDPEEKWETCVHEAGHAVVGIEVSVGDLEFVVVAREVGHLDGKAGHVHWKRKKRRNRTRQAYLDEIAMIMAGMAAEKVVIGDVLDGSGGSAGSDLQHASDIGTLMISNLGLDSLYYADVSNAEELDALRRSDSELRRHVEAILKAQLHRAEEIVRSRRGAVERLAGMLMERECLTGEEVLKLIDRNPGNGQNEA